MVSPDRVQKAMNAASNGDVKTLRLMLKGGVPVNHVERSVYGGGMESLLSLAAHNGQFDVFEFLLAEGADISFRAIMAAGNDLSMLEVACGDRLNPQIVQTILTQSDVSQADKDFALVIAAYDSLDAVNMLLRAGADVNATGRYGDTALLNAVMAGKESIAVRLVEAGADASVRQLNSDLDYWKKSVAEIAREMKLLKVLHALEAGGRTSTPARKVQKFSTVEECWQAIDQILREKNCFHAIPGPVQPCDALAAWERLPALMDLVASLTCHDGSGVVSLCEVPHHDAFFLRNLQDIVGEGRTLTQLSQDEVAANDSDEFWRPSWLPFAANGAGDCLFVDSASNDESAPVSLFDHELRKTTILWPSILAMLTDVANDVIDGVFQPEA